MKKTILLIMTICLSTLVRAEVFPYFGVDSVGSDFFREWYVTNDLVHYLDNGSDNVFYEAETTGEWNMPDQKLFSIAGNPYKWNKYYLNGFRIDNRFQVGSMLYHADMNDHTVLVDYHNGTLTLQTDSVRRNLAQLTYNLGRVGNEVSAGTKWLINLFHKSASERNMPGNDLTRRAFMRGAGELEAGYGISAFGKQYYQHVYANLGARSVVYFNQKGTAGMYDAGFYQVQVDGELPMPKNKAIDHLYYLFNANSREDWGSEFVYNDNEVAHLEAYSLSIYGNKDFHERGKLTTGLTWGLSDIAKQNPAFARNLIDQDGEGFEPYYADGALNELNWAVNYQYDILPWLQLKVDAYNSLLHWSPSKEHWTTSTYYQRYNDSLPTQLYTYQWESQAFTSGLLENAVTVEAKKWVKPWLQVQGLLGVSLDGILLGNGKSIVSPNWLMQAAVYMKPKKWFEMTISLSKHRSTYTWDDIRFMSDDYMNAHICYTQTGDLFSTTGGRYHHWEKYLRQPSYVVLDLPFKFTIGRHEISMLQSLRFYYDLWMTQYDQTPENYGFYQEHATLVTDKGEAWTVTNPIFFENASEKHYVVGYENKDLLGNNFFTNKPLYLSNVVKYAYNGRKVFFSISWQSYLMSGLSALGNGVQSNNIGILSESTANPNTFLNEKNTDGAFRASGRVDQDRSFIARIQLGYNITPNWGIHLNGKFKDGTPITNFRTLAYTDVNGNTQLAVWNADTKGINLSAYHFGKRKDAFFNIDVRLRYRGHMRQVPLEAEVMCYNIYDFGTELFEFNFDEDMGRARRAMVLNIPRGMMFTLRVGLGKEER